MNKGSAGGTNRPEQSSRDANNASNDKKTSAKGLKMKIKRKAPQGSGASGGNKGAESSGTQAAGKHEIVKPGSFSGGSTAGGSGTSTNFGDKHDSSSSSTNTSSGGSGMAPKAANPFEKLTQAILEQEKSRQQKQQQHKSSLASEKEKSKDGQSGASQGHASASIFGRNIGGGHGTSNDGPQVKREAKLDPYEFNAKNEDRLSGGLQAAKKIKQEKEKPEMRDVMTDTSHMACITDPDCLGPCEPGTSVVLEGIVWQETANGILVVNVTWRGKSYVGTLLDSTKHIWAPPTFRSDSPNDPDARTPRTRGKRGRTTMNSMGGRGMRSTRNSSQQGGGGGNPPPSPSKSNNGGSSSSQSSVAGEKRKQDLLSELTAAGSGSSPAKKLRVDDDTPRPPVVIEDTWYVCFHTDCNKRYREISALKYHQNNAHKQMLLTREQSSDHNRTHVRFMPASSAHAQHSNTAAQTEQCSKDVALLKKGKKSKKSKRNKDEAMDFDTTGSSSTDLFVISGQRAPDMLSVSGNAAAANVVATLSIAHSFSSPESSNNSVSLKQPRIELTPLGATGGAGVTTKTVTAPIVSVPLGTPAQNSPAALAALSKEERKRERRKRKKERKEKKLLLEQQQEIQQKENEQKLANSSPSLPTPASLHTVNKSPPDVSNKNRSSLGVLTPQTRPLPSMQRQLPLSSDRNKIEDPTGTKQVSQAGDNCVNDSAQSPAYSDISDEGNDNVPVLENEVELSKKQQQTGGTQSCLTSNTSRPKESHSNEQLAKGPVPVQEPPNLTPVITHTGLSTKTVLASQQPLHSNASTAGPPSSQMFVTNSIANKELATAPNILNARTNVSLATATQNSSSVVDLNRPREVGAAVFSNHNSMAELAHKSSASNEMHANKQRLHSANSGLASNVSPQSTGHTVFPSYPPGYNLSHGNSAGNSSVNSSNKGTPLAASSPLSPPSSQERLSHPLQSQLQAQKAVGHKEDPLKLQTRSIVSPNRVTSKLSPKLSGLPPVMAPNRATTDSRSAQSQGGEPSPRRHVDSNMNMQPKQLALANGPQPMVAGAHVNKTNPQLSGDINKQVGTLAVTEVGKSNQSVSAEHKQRLAASEGLLMSASERQSENEKILKENIELKTQMSDKDREKGQLLFEQQRYMALMQPQQRRSLEQQRRAAVLEATKSKPGLSVERPSDLHLSPNRPPSLLASQSSPHTTPGGGSAQPRWEASPMPSPKTKAELKQVGERKEGGGRPEGVRTAGSEHRRPGSSSGDKHSDVSRANAMKSPSPAPPPGAFPPHPQGPFGHYPYPGFLHPYAAHPFMFGPGSPYMPYALPPQESKALEMLQQHASQYYGSLNNKAQDLRKPPERKGSPSPNTEGPERGASKSGERGWNPLPEKRESPAPPRQSPQMSSGQSLPPHSMSGLPGVPLSPWHMHSVCSAGAAVPMGPQSQQQHASKH